MGMAICWGFSISSECASQTDLLHLKAAFNAFLRAKMYYKHFVGMC